MTSTDLYHGFSLSFLLFSDGLTANKSAKKGEIVRALSTISKVFTKYKVT
jgi:hypothetical protein